MKEGLLKGALVRVNKNDNEEPLEVKCGAIGRFFGWDETQAIVNIKGQNHSLRTFYIEPLDGHLKPINGPYRICVSAMGLFLTACAQANSEIYYLKPCFRNLKLVQTIVDKSSPAFQQIGAAITLINDHFNGTLNPKWKDDCHQYLCDAIKNLE
jgi:hypothetical protein